MNGISVLVFESEISRGETFFMISEARVRANKKYKAKVEDIIIRVKKGRKSKLKAYAKSLGLSLNAYIISLINEDINSSD